MNATWMHKIKMGLALAHGHPSVVPLSKKKDLLYLLSFRLDSEICFSVFLLQTLLQIINVQILSFLLIYYPCDCLGSALSAMTAKLQEHAVDTAVDVNSAAAHLDFHQQLLPSAAQGQVVLALAFAEQGPLCGGCQKAWADREVPDPGRRGSRITAE